MKQIQEYNNSIYYIQNYVLCEYNILTKRRYKRCKLPHIEYVRYQIVADNLIVYEIDGQSYLNKIRLDSDIIVMHTPNGNRYIIMNTYHNIIIANYKGEHVKTTTENIFWKYDNGTKYCQCDISNNGKIVIWDSKIHTIGLNNNMETIKTRVKWNLQFTRTIWVRNSCILRLVKENINNK